MDYGNPQRSVTFEIIRQCIFANFSKFRLNSIKRNFEKYPDTLSEFEERLEKEMNEKTAEEVKLEDRVQEIREYFGYWIGKDHIF